MSQTLTFRFMEERDLDAIVELENRCFTVPWTRNAFYNELHQNKFACYIAVSYTHLTLPTMAVV